MMSKLKKKVAKKYGVVIEEVEKFPDEALALLPKTDALRRYANKSDVEQRWIARLDGKIVGLVTIEDPAAHGLSHLVNTKYIQVIVSPKARGQGIGEKLLTTAFRNADDEPRYWAGFTHHSPGFKKLAEKYGIRDNDDVSRYDEDDPNWQDDGSYIDD